MSGAPQSPQPPEDETHRNLVNLIAAIFVLALAIAAIWVFKALDEHRQIENCIASGRRDCLPLGDQPSGQ
jgi:cytochrome b